MGAGLEYLFPSWELRANGYFPVGRKVSSRESVQFNHFSGNNMFIGFKREFAFTGGDAEIAWHIKPLCNLDLYMGAGPYYFKGHFKKGAWGGKARLEAKITDYVTLRGIYSYDQIFHSRGSGELAFNIPFGKRKCITRTECCCRDSQKMLQTSVYSSPFRNEIMVLDRKKETEIAVDPATGNPLFFVFVDNTSSSNGTFESPFPTLLAAELASKPGDIIYVFPGDGTNTGMNAGITLQNYQRFLGSFVSHRFNTQFGNIEVPSLSTVPPLMNNDAGVVAVQMSTGTEVSGFLIADQLASSLADININRNSFEGGTDIVVNLSFDTSGYVLINQNRMIGSSGVGVGIILTNNSNDITSQIENNTLKMDVANCIIYSYENGVNFSLVKNNELTTTFLNCVQYADSSSAHQISILNNTMNTQGFGVVCIESSGLVTKDIVIKNNTFNGSEAGPNGGGVLISSSMGIPVNASIAANTMLNTSIDTYTGIRLTSGDVFQSNINSNLIIDNGTSTNSRAIQISGDLYDLFIHNNRLQNSAGPAINIASIDQSRFVIDSNICENNCLNNTVYAFQYVSSAATGNCLLLTNNSFVNNLQDVLVSNTSGTSCVKMTGNSAPSWGYTLSQSGGTFNIDPSFIENVGPFFIQTGSTINTQSFDSCCIFP